MPDPSYATPLTVAPRRTLRLALILWGLAVGAAVSTFICTILTIAAQPFLIDQLSCNEGIQSACIHFYVAQFVHWTAIIGSIAGPMLFVMLVIWAGATTLHTRLLFDKDPGTVLIAWMAIVFANMLKLIVVPQLYGCFGPFYSPAWCHMAAIPAGASQPLSEVPVAYLVQVYPILSLVLVIVGMIVSAAVGFYLNQRQSRVRAVVQALLMSPLILMIVVGFAALLPWIA